MYSFFLNSSFELFGYLELVSFKNQVFVSTSSIRPTNGGMFVNRQKWLVSIVLEIIAD
jgi:hypothetical protein